MSKSAMPVDVALSLASGTGVHLPSRTIFLTGDVSSEMLAKFLPALYSLDRPGAPIRVILSTHGGDAGSGHAIYDAMRMAQSPVVVDAYGSCMSMGAVLLQGGDLRRIAPQCRFMIHNCFLEMSDGNANKLLVTAKEASHMDERNAEILSLRSEKTTKEIIALFENDTFLSAEQTVKCGFADSVLSYSDKGLKITKRKSK